MVTLSLLRWRMAYCAWPPAIGCSVNRRPALNSFPEFAVAVVNIRQRRWDALMT